MPSCWQAAMMRMAISPRLAIRTDLNIVRYPGGAALFEEGADALLAFGAGAQAGDGGDGGLAGLGVAQLGDGAGHELAGADAGRARLADGVELGVHGGIELGGGDDLMDEADGVGV